MAPDHPHQMVAAVLPHALLRIAASGLGTHGGLTRIPAVVVAQVSRLIDGSATVWILGRGSDEAPLTASNHTPAARTALQDQAASTDTSIPARPDLTGATQPTALDILGPYTLIPVTGDNHRLGMIAVSRDPGHPPFTPGDVGALHTVADLCAVVLQQARMLNDSLIALEELRTQVEQPSQVSDALIVCDPTMRILNWNTGAERIYGYPHSEALGCDLFALLATHRLEPDGQPSPNDPLLDATLDEDRLGSWGHRG